MKTKLTLTIDPSVTHLAKAVARERGVSLSAMVEEALKKATVAVPPAIKEISFSERWGGEMKLRENQSERAKKLHKKYGLGAPH